MTLGQCVCVCCDTVTPTVHVQCCVCDVCVMYCMCCAKSGVPACVQ